MSRQETISKSLVVSVQKIELSTSSVQAVNAHFENIRRRLSKERVRRLAALPAENRPAIRIAYSEEEPNACFGLIDGGYSLAAACENSEQMVICDVVNIDHRPKLREKIAKRNIAHDRALTPEEMSQTVSLRLISSAPDRAGQVTAPSQRATILPTKVLFDLPRDLDKASILRKIAGVMVSIHTSTNEHWPVEAVKKLLDLLAELHRA